MTPVAAGSGNRPFFVGLVRVRGRFGDPARIGSRQIVLLRPGCHRMRRVLSHHTVTVPFGLPSNCNNRSATNCSSAVSRSRAAPTLSVTRGSGTCTIEVVGR